MLEVRADVASEGFRWVTVGAPDQDVDIVLFQPHGGRSQAEGDALLSPVTQGSLQAAIFRSDDLDTTLEKGRASGAEVLQEPSSVSNAEMTDTQAPALHAADSHDLIRVHGARVNNLEDLSVEIFVQGFMPTLARPEVDVPGGLTTASSSTRSGWPRTPAPPSAR